MQRFSDFDFGVSWVMGFFHQDWIYEGPTAADMVAKLLAGDTDEEALAVRRDARLLDTLPSKTLEVLWNAGAQYMPSFERIGGGTQWTRTVGGLCDARLSANEEVSPLAGADMEDGTAELDAIVAEIERAEFLAAEVRSALADCARHCSPDLAFRILLRAMVVAPDGSLSPDQYARLEAIGSALHYGEYVVDTVKFLIEQD
ncbi:hypothetical protein ACFV5G_35060 [Streptomyces sp. NPDC059766]|uniref:hypothetical protein n=1 Tax=Streptomyces sp. NPDC059766 TaxID=3346940 RepID=UPI003669B091